MSGLTFRLNTYPDERLDLSPLIPSRLASLPLTDILALVVGTTKRQLKVGDFFAVSGQSGDTVTIQGGSEHLDFVGAGLDRGTLILDGDAGAYAGRKMTGGELHIRGRAGVWLGSGLSGGLITVKGSAGDQVGSMCPGDKFGMTGGIVHVEGSIGDRVGEKMRRGTIIAPQDTVCLDLRAIAGHGVRPAASLHGGNRRGHACLGLREGRDRRGERIHRECRASSRS